MQPITRRSVIQLGAGAATAALVGGCSAGPAGGDGTNLDEPDPNTNLTGMPIVNEPITLQMMTRRSPNTAEDWNAVASMKKMEEISNIAVDWGAIPWEGGTERRNLALASGDYPGILNRMGLGSVDLAKYGEQGTFMALNELIESYMPNLKAILDANPDIRSGITLPDGNIYAMPTVYDPDFDALLMARKLWVRQDWLDDLGLDVPTTVEEFEAYLEAVMADPPVEGVVPFTDGASGTRMIEILGGTFGILNRGRTTLHLDADDSGRARFYPTTDGYRETLEFLNRLYSKDLLPADLFTIDQQKETALGREGLVAATVSMAPSEYFGAVGADYVALPPLKRSSTDPVPSWTSVSSPLAGTGGFVLTDTIEHPIEAARWMDHFYGEEGTRLFFMGVEGESYEKTANGGYELLPEITDNPDGKTPNEALRPYVNYFGGGYAGIVMEDYFMGTENSEQSRAGTEVVADHRLEEVWPAFSYTVDEAAELTGLSVDIDKLVGESVARFINGETALSSWDTHLGQFERIGLPRYLEIQQAALDRYLG
ncbi:MAG TPA: extracellular solute-binding protein [Candidatus Avipropionibacterium avicola]|uniref:Extracellular solute-binding protein n=1 Tax=Candidatus Avipropionibacterium avicola TaxID=2840701 RepID=A0A9D1KMV1_9ACTN|nr:extracellular solute-binding protein [Candidatus Avipropionibacterium avicola]